MQESRKRNNLIIVICCVLIVGMFFELCLTPSFAADKNSSKNKVKIGATYILLKQKNIYRGPGKDYGIRKKDELNYSVQRYTVKKLKKAKLKKGTKVTFLEKKNNWIRIPSGWIVYDKKDFKRVKKEATVRK